MEEEQYYEGTVKNFANNYGFIRRDDGAADVFVHYTNINQKGFKNLLPGQKVIFTLALGPKKLFEAKNVTIVQDLDDSEHEVSSRYNGSKVSEFLRKL